MMYCVRHILKILLLTVAYSGASAQVVNYYPPPNTLYSLSNGGVAYGGATGGLQGQGTVNARNYYKNGVLLPGNSCATDQDVIFYSTSLSGFTCNNNLAFDGNILSVSTIGMTGSGSNPTYGIQLNGSFICVWTNGNCEGGVDAQANWVFGRASSHATTDTNGFLYLPFSAGVPTGVPAQTSGNFAFGVPLRYDSTDNRLYAYNSGWQNLTPTAGSPGGSNTQIQYNNSGAFGGSTLTYNTSTGTVTSTPASGTGLVGVSPAIAISAIQANCMSGTFSATGNTCLALVNSSASGQTPIDFYGNAGVLSGRIRNDFAGDISYVAFSTGEHDFLVGGDVGVGNTALTIRSSGIIAKTTLTAGGTVPTITGCGTISAQSGGTNAGQFTPGSTGVISCVLTFPTTAPHGYTCAGSNLTVGSVSPQVSTISTTACTIQYSGASSGVSVLTYQAIAY